MRRIASGTTIRNHFRVRIPNICQWRVLAGRHPRSAVRRTMDVDAIMTKEKTSIGCFCGLWLHGTTFAWYSLQNARLQPVGSLACFPLSPTARTSFRE